MDYSNIVVDKPWGFEYLCFRNGVVAVWMLNIQQGLRTSLHCHPSKNTGLVVISGQARLIFLNNSILLNRLDKIHIFRSRFHSTEALSTGGLWLLEIEAPEDKEDLVRLEDSYGRESMGYEGADSYFTPTDDYFQISDPSTSSQGNCFQGVEFRHISSVSSSDVAALADDSKIILTNGGLVTPKDQKILWPGDVVDKKTMLRLMGAYELLPETTLLLLK
jgi:mannose-6-phosphate isomerase-like protein (cupin superfamily)